MGGQENKLQMLQISQNQILRMMILPECVFSIPVKFEIYLASMDQEKLNGNKFKITGKQCKKTMIDIISMEFLLLG